MSNHDYRPMHLPPYPECEHEEDDIDLRRRMTPPATPPSVHAEIEAWFGHLVFFVLFVLGFVPLATFSYKLTRWLWLGF